MYRALLLGTLLALLVVAKLFHTPYGWYMPEIYARGISIQLTPNIQTVIDVYAVTYNDYFVHYCEPGYVGCVEPQYSMTPGVVASAWAPGGKPVEYVYKRAMALFEAPQNVSPRTHIKWNEWIFWGARLRKFGPGVYESYLKDSRVIYSFDVAVKLGRGPVLTCLQEITYPVVDPWPLRERVIDWRKLFNTTCPGHDAAKVIGASVYWFRNYTDFGKLCVSWAVFWQPWWYRWGGYWFLNDIKNPLLEYSKCIPRDTPPKNITAIAGKDGVYFYVDGEFFYKLDTTPLSNEEPWLYTGPYLISYVGSTTTAAYVAIQDLDGRAAAPLGRLWLLIGNDTLAVPKYVINMLWGLGRLEAGVDFDGFSVYVRPGVSTEPTVLEHKDVEVVLHGERTKAQNGTYFTCEVGEPVAVGNVVRLGRGYLVRGPAELYCTHYSVYVAGYNSTERLVGERGARLLYTPRDVLLPNGTLLKAEPFAVVFNIPGRVYTVNYTKLYRVVVETPLGRNETFLPPGTPVRISGDYVLPNGTRIALRPYSIPVERPLRVKANYTVYYLVRVVSPHGAVERWAERGSPYLPSAPDPWEPGNGTRLAGLLINGTPAAAVAVDRPLTLVLSYAERYYWISVKTPVNKTEGWFKPGTTFVMPPVVDFGNGTRLVDPDPPAVAVEGPLSVSVTYRRQHWVEIRGVEEWRGWAYEGSVIRLNGTAAGGVRYTPLVPQVEVRGPASVTARYQASYYGEFKDALGIPNPTAEVELCGRVYRADAAGRIYASVETEGLCQLEARQWPLSPYTLGALSAVLAAAALRRRR
ncbi:hypothetical protein [Pyrobaculum arsenaticum]|uniref:Uncharacterized protein n=1 Tax=Pyrobaculum arsenaticum (strain DSM 13514 / JCM 11321 / PZ6) TaxID=340102 RepID=A4WKV4_PYRAR|nr:hypothetical protein [Pyrobaculum arsenaticum]ABP51021.1 hypothetical protein Pars_1464 [Pyrobaculum arsenaticum DSM 13514]